MGRKAVASRICDSTERPKQARKEQTKRWHVGETFLTDLWKREEDKKGELSGFGQCKRHRLYFISETETTVSEVNTAKSRCRDARPRHGLIPEFLFNPLHTALQFFLNVHYIWEHLKYQEEEKVRGFKNIIRTNAHGILLSIKVFIILLYNSWNILCK